MLNSLLSGVIESAIRRKWMAQLPVVWVMFSTGFGPSASLCQSRSNSRTGMRHSTKTKSFVQRILFMRQPDREYVPSFTVGRDRSQHFQRNRSEEHTSEL